MSTVPYHSPSAHDNTSEGRRLLLIFGVLLILLGGLCAFAAIGLLLSAVQGQSTAFTNLPPEFDSNTFIIQLFLLLGVLAILLLWTGIASILRRRWTRPIVISFSGMFLFGIAVSVLQLAVPQIHDRYLAAPPPPRISPGRIPAPAPAADPTQDLVLCAMAIAAIGIPLLFLYAYRSRAVQLALNEHDPTITWADRAPIPVLALAIALEWTAFLAIIQLIPSPVPYFFEDAYPILDWVFSIALALFLAVCAAVVHRQHPAGTLMAILAAFVIGVTTMLFETHAINNQPHPPSGPWQVAAPPDVQPVAIGALLAALAYVIPALAYILYANSKMNKR